MRGDQTLLTFENVLELSDDPTSVLRAIACFLASTLFKSEKIGINHPYLSHVFCGYQT